MAPFGFCKRKNIINKNRINGCIQYLLNYITNCLVLEENYLKK